MITRLLMLIKKKLEESVIVKQKREDLEKEVYYIVSKKANPNNIIIDTCAFKNNNGLKLIEQSEKVSILLPTIEEMDRVCRRINNCKCKKKEEKRLVANISRYSKKILKEEIPKYELIEFYSNEDYVDTIILKYLKSIPRNKRPTLITADKFLALRAKTMKIEYIFIEQTQSKTKKIRKSEIKPTKGLKDDTQQEELLKEKIVNQNLETKTITPQTEQKEKLNVIGVNISYKGNKVKLKRYCKDSNICIIKDNNCDVIKSNEIELDKNSLDYIVIMKYMEKHKNVRIIKLEIKENEIEYNTYDCLFINDIYKLPIHEDALEKAKNILAQKAQRK